jgi:DNA end-binding protein Ku
MAKPIWTGTIAFGLVNIPVKLFSAISVPTLDLGYAGQNYVILEDKDFEKASAEKTKRIEITPFVKEQEIDPIYYESTYYLEPGAKDTKPYTLLRNAMKKTGRCPSG